MDSRRRQSSWFRVWIVQYDRWQPPFFDAVPPRAVAREVAEDEVMSRQDARTYADAFNRAALGGRRRLWAVVVPVTPRYEGEPEPGQVWPPRTRPRRPR